MAYDEETDESPVHEAKEKLKADKEYWSEIYSRGKEDAFFLSDAPYAQWDETDFNNRIATNRPALTVDQLSQFVHQVANDIRINTPTINVIPTGYDSDAETAEVYKGLIKNIEYVSNADNAYDTAAYNAIKQSLGWIRVDHDYVDETSFDQQLLIKRVVNPFACWIDRASMEIDGRDAKHATIIDKIRVCDFKDKYPDKDPVCFEEDDKANLNDDDFISIAEHFCVEETYKTISIDEAGNITEGGTPNAKRTRKVAASTIKRYKMSGADVLEETTFPGKYIPIVPVYGEENWVNGKRNLLSLIRKSKDAQRMFNLWKSLETELLMKAPQAPVMAAEGQVEDYADDWKNPSKAAVLRYKTTDIDGKPIGAPQRLEPPTIPTGIVNAARGAVDDIKSSMGMYNASLGQRSNEQSGVAIAQRKQEGDVATYHFSDNLMKAITQVGRILVSCIPEIYDSARVLRIIGMEDEPKSIGVNGELAEGQEETINLLKGSYDVKVVTGASYTTLRQESVAALQDVFKAAPDLMNVMGDLYFKYSDFAGAQAMANRMKKVVDPKFLDKEERDDEQPQVDPEKQQMAMLIEQGKQALIEMQSQMQELNAQLKNKQIETAIKAREVEIKGQEVAIKANDTAQKQTSYELEALKIQTDRELKEKEIQADLVKAWMDKQAQQVMPEQINQMADFAATIQMAMQAVAEAQVVSSQTLSEAMTRPKQVITDEQGNIVGIS